MPLAPPPRSKVQRSMPPAVPRSDKAAAEDVASDTSRLLRKALVAGTVRREHRYRSESNFVGLARHGIIGGGKHTPMSVNMMRPYYNLATGHPAPTCRHRSRPDVTGVKSLPLLHVVGVFGGIDLQAYRPLITATCSLTVRRAVKPMRPSKSPAKAALLSGRR